jgi:hypothetical protein
MAALRRTFDQVALAVCAIGVESVGGAKRGGRGPSASAASLIRPRMPMHPRPAPHRAQMLVDIRFGMVHAWCIHGAWCLAS